MFLDEIANSLGQNLNISITGEECLPSYLAVSDLAAASISSVGGAIANLLTTLDLAPSLKTNVDRRSASLWFGQSIQPIGWKMPPTWDAIAGDYKARDGWIRLHTNAQHHKDAALKVLKCAPTREAVGPVVSEFAKDELETAIVRAGGAAAAMHSHEDWSQHLQGKAVAREPLIAWDSTRSGPPISWSPTLERPLAGLRVLDLTRILAGPVATRTLSGFGAEVLRVDPYGWEEPIVVPDTTLGKRCCRLDLSTEKDLDHFAQLLSQAHVLVHGYRPGALDGLGIGEEERYKIAPNHIEVSLNAYGWTGPWRNRRGFDSLVQMSSGIAHEGMNWANKGKPTPLPVQALDHATGYLMAASVVTSLGVALRTAKLSNARLSLARTAELLKKQPQDRHTNFEATFSDHDFNQENELTSWGDARRLAPPINVGTVPMHWDLPACELGSSAAHWK